MGKGRPAICIHCGSARSIRKGFRMTKTKGLRRRRRCKECGRRFTPKHQKPVIKTPATSGLPDEAAHGYRE